MTVKYVEYEAVIPPDSVPSPSGFAFYGNRGQIIDMQDSVRMDIKYYATNHYPALYFSNPIEAENHRMLSYVFSKADEDTSTTDTLHRVNLTFQLDYKNAEPVNLETRPVSTDKNNQGYLNYYLPQCSNGVTFVEGFNRLYYPSIFDNTDVLFYGNNAGMKFYVILKPSAEPDVNLRFTGQDTIIVTDSTCRIVTSVGSYTYSRPDVFQIDANGDRQEVSFTPAYDDWGNGRVGFTLGSYDTGLPLVIEVGRETTPEPEHMGDNHDWSTYFQGNGYDEGTGVATDASGFPFFTGFTASSDFPTDNGINMNNILGDFDAYIAKFKRPSYYTPITPDERLYVTYYGSSGTDKAFGIAVDASGNPYITGFTDGNNFDISNNDNYTFFKSTISGGKDAFIVKLDGALGTRRYASYIGGSADDEGKCITIDGSGNIYIGGITASSPTANTCTIPTDNGFPLCDPGSSAFFDATNGGNTDGFMFKLNSAGALVWSTYVGDSESDRVNTIVTDGAGNLFAAGATASSSFPVFDPTSTTDFFQGAIGGGTNDGWIAKFNNGSVKQWITFYGGSGDDEIFGIDIDNLSTPNLYVTGRTSSPPATCCNCALPNPGEFPTCNPTGADDYFQGTYGGGAFDAFVAKFTNAGEFKWGTYFGSAQEDFAKSIVCDKVNTGAGATNNVIIAGRTFSPAMPLQNPAQSVLYLGGFYLYDTFGGGGNWISTTSGTSEAFIEMFTDDGTDVGVPAWGVTYGEPYFWPSSAGHEQTNSITSTKAISNIPDKQMYVTGFTDNSQLATICHQAFINNGTPCFEQQYSSNISASNPDAFLIRFSYQPTFIGIEENNPVYSDITVYPNPASESITIVWNVRYGKQKPHIRIYDVIGALVHDEAIETSGTILKKNINLAHLENGTYIVRIEADDFMPVKKFILVK